MVELASSPRLFEPLVRKRAFIRLAEGFDRENRGNISREAVDRTLRALDGFVAVARKLRVDTIHAVATGVVRKAANRGEFLDLIFERTGIRVHIISGEEEGSLTRAGVLHSLNIQGKPFVIFDLGGGTTEFVFAQNDDAAVKSVPLGAVILDQQYLASDPPQKKELEALTKQTETILSRNISEHASAFSGALLVGTGGTVTALAVMIHGIERKDIRPAKMDGLTLKKERLGDLFSRLKTMARAQIVKHYGLDQGRADVIQAGCAAVTGIVDFFQSPRITVSLSDLLEGTLLVNLDGE